MPATTSRSPAAPSSGSPSTIGLAREKLLNVLAEVDQWTVPVDQAGHDRLTERRQRLTNATVSHSSLADATRRVNCLQLEYLEVADTAATDEPPRIVRWMAILFQNWDLHTNPARSLDLKRFREAMRSPSPSQPAPIPTVPSPTSDNPPPSNDRPHATDKHLSDAPQEDGDLDGLPSIGFSKDHTPVIEENLQDDELGFDSGEQDRSGGAGLDESLAEESERGREDHRRALGGGGKRREEVEQEVEREVVKPRKRKLTPNSEESSVSKRPRASPPPKTTSDAPARINDDDGDDDDDDDDEDHPMDTNEGDAADRTLTTSGTTFVTPCSECKTRDTDCQLNVSKPKTACLLCGRLKKKCEKSIKKKKKGGKGKRDEGKEREADKEERKKPQGKARDGVEHRQGERGAGKDQQMQGKAKAGEGSKSGRGRKFKSAEAIGDTDEDIEGPAKSGRGREGMSVASGQASSVPKPASGGNPISVAATGGTVRPQQQHRDLDYTRLTIYSPCARYISTRQAVLATRKGEPIGHLVPGAQVVPHHIGQVAPGHVGELAGQPLDEAVFILAEHKREVTQRLDEIDGILRAQSRNQGSSCDKCVALDEEFQALDTRLASAENTLDVAGHTVRKLQDETCAENESLRKRFSVFDDISERMKYVDQEVGKIVQLELDLKKFTRDHVKQATQTTTTNMQALVTQQLKQQLPNNLDALVKTQVDGAVAALTTKVNELSDFCTYTDGNFDILNAATGEQLQTIEQDVEKVKTQVNSGLERMNSSMAQRFQTLEADIENIRREGSASTEAIEALRGEGMMADLEERISDLEKATLKQAQDTASIQAQIAGLEVQMVDENQALRATIAQQAASINLILHYIDRQQDGARSVSQIFLPKYSSV